MPDINLSTIEGHRTVNLINDDDIIVNEKIDDNCKVTLNSRNGNITILNKIDNNRTVTLIASGDVNIGTSGGDPDGDRKIDKNCSVEVEAGGSISLGSRINNNCNVRFDADGDVRIGTRIDDNCRVFIESGGAVFVGDMVNNNSVLELRAVSNVTIGGKIDDNCNATIEMLRGGITISGKVDNNTTVFLSAALDVLIGTTGGSDDRKINNRCHVYATSGGQIQVGDKIGDDCIVEFRACGPITIGGVLERGCHAFFVTQEANDISVRRIRDNNTQLTYWGGRLVEAESRNQTPLVEKRRWVNAPLFCAGLEFDGEWWQSWSWKYGYVAREKNLPETLEQLVEFVSGLAADDRTKAVGGAWSFKDASLPFDTEEAVDNFSIEKRGIGGKQPVPGLFEGVGRARDVSFDHQPNTLFRDRQVSSTWSQSRLTNLVRSGFHLPGAQQGSSIIDTRHLCSSLQSGFSTIASSQITDEILAGRHFFHVEAGITMENLYTLLDHQKPRLAVQATGGARGATLAGTISTATHGGEFKFPLLIDRVKAIHLVGPGGEEWWIEGHESIADFNALSAQYPNIDAEHFIAGDWTHAECDQRFTPQDMLRAVTVSMGTMGVIYSIVLEVVPAFGIQQRAKRIGNWRSDLLSNADVTESQLRERDAAANLRVLDFILDGNLNGTGIPRAENIYIDLVLNPITQESWITNRRVTPRIPRESKELDMSMVTYEKSFSQQLTNDSAGLFGILNNEMIARLL